MGIEDRQSLARGGNAEEGPSLLCAGGLTLDRRRRQISCGGHLIHLTPKECCLLATLMRHRGQVLSRGFLMRKVWDTDFVGDTRTLEVHICQLRGKLTQVGSPPLIRTVRGVGYVFRPEAL